MSKKKIEKDIFLIKASPSKKGIGSEIMEIVEDVLESSNFKTTVTIYNQSDEEISTKYQISLEDFFHRDSRKITDFEKNIMKSDAIILVCPVYFRHMPGEFKMTLDSFSYRSHEFPLLGKKVIIITYCTSNGADELSNYFKMVFSSLGAEIISIQSYYTAFGQLEEEVAILQNNIIAMLNYIENNVYRVTNNQEKLFQYYKSIVQEELKNGIITNKQERWNELLDYNNLTEYIEKNLLN